MKTYVFLSGLVLYSASFCVAQAPVPLNVLPSRVVGHPLPETTTINSASPNLVEGREMYNPEGIAVDTSVSPPILYVSDTGNNRVLAWKNALAFQNGQKADLVIGQQDMYHTSPQGPSGNFQSGLNSPNGLIVDANGNLYVADSFNNRVLRYPKPFAQFAQTGAVVPDLWVGQPNLKSGAANFTGAVASQGLNLAASPFPINIALDAQNNLWVVDAGNRRVLRFPATQVAAGGGPLQADLVLGQIDFVSTNQPQPTANNRTVAGSFSVPIGIAFDSKGNLYISDSTTDYSIGRVLVFAPPFSIGQNATRLMGIPPSNISTTCPSGTSNCPVLDSTLFAVPAGMFFIPSASKMGLLDADSHRILLFDTIDKWPDPSVSVSPQATAAIGQPDCHNRAANAGATFRPAPTASTMYLPLAAVYSGNQLFLADTGNSRVLVLPTTSGTGNCSQTPSTLLGAATNVLGQDTFAMSAANLIEGREFDFTSSTSNGTAADAGVAVDTSSATPHLYVADPYNNRILGFNDFRSLKPGAKADIVLGQPDFSSGLCNVTGDPNNPTAASLCRPAGLAVDSNGNLYVADTGNSRVLRFPAPFAHQGTLEQADLVLGQRQFTFSVTDPTSATMSAPYGLAISPGNGLLVSDIAHNRVLYFAFTGNGTFTAGTDNGLAATKVFGQQNFNSTASGNTATALSSPHHIAVDNEARLYVADAGNNRVQIFNQIAGTATPATGASALFSITGLTQPRSVFVNPLTSEIWVGDTTNTVKKYPLYETLSTEQTPTFTASVAAGSAALAIAQDQYGDMAIADATNRVGFYFPAVEAINGGSFLESRPLAPGLLASICSPSSACDPAKRQPLFGSNTASSSSLPNPLPLPTTLGDVQVQMSWTQSDGSTYTTLVPLYFVSPGQINFVVPMNAPQSGYADIQVIQASTGRVYADNAQVLMAPYSPAIMMLDYSGNLRRAAVINLADGTVNSPTNPAPRGSFISIYATGQGFCPNAPADGAPVNGAVPCPAVVRINMNGTWVDQMPYDSASDIPQNQWLPYSGLNFYPGLWQINVYIPHAVAPNTQLPLIITADGEPSVDPQTFRTYISVK